MVEASRHLDETGWLVQEGQAGSLNPLSRMIHATVKNLKLHQGAEGLSKPFHCLRARLLNILCRYRLV